MSRQSNATLLPAYAAIGTDELKMARVVERMDKRLAESGGDPDFDREVLEGDKLSDPAMLRSSLDTLPFFGPFRLVIIKGVDKAPKQVADAIVAYLEKPSESTVVMMTATKLPKNTRLYKAVVKRSPDAIVDCAPKKAYELVPKVVEMARSHGLSLDHEAADMLVRLLGESTVLIDSELGKLSCAHPNGRIDATKVREMVPRVTEVKPWDFTEAIGKRDPGLAARLFWRIPEKDIYPLFMATVSFIRELVCAKVASTRAEIDLAGEIGSLRGRPVQTWQIKNHAGWARSYSREELAGALKTAAACDEGLKSSSDKETVFLKWVFSFCQ